MAAPAALVAEITLTALDDVGPGLDAAASQIDALDAQIKGMAASWDATSSQMISANDATIASQGEQRAARRVPSPPVLRVTALHRLPRHPSTITGDLLVLRSGVGAVHDCHGFLV